MSTYNQTQQIVEDRNRLRHNPRHHPDKKANGHPRSDGRQVSAVHLIGSTEESHVDILASNVSEHDTGENSLFRSVIGSNMSSRKG